VRRVPNFLTTPLLLLSLAGASGVVSDSGSDDGSIFDERVRREVERVKVGKRAKRLVFVSARVTTKSPSNIHEVNP
jgi:hypothetical protein